MEKKLMAINTVISPVNMPLNIIYIPDTTCSTHLDLDFQLGIPEMADKSSFATHVELWGTGGQ